MAIIKTDSKSSKKSICGTFSPNIGKIEKDVRLRGYSLIEAVVCCLMRLAEMS